MSPSLEVRLEEVDPVKHWLAAYSPASVDVRHTVPVKYSILDERAHSELEGRH